MTDAIFEPTSPGAAEVLTLYDAFIREADGPLGIDLETEIAAGPPADLAPPDGLLLLARIEAEPLGLGGVRHLDTAIAEIKSVYVAPGHRGKGVAMALLRELERIARRRGCAATRLDTSSYLTPAVAFYRAAGYIEVPAYNANPKADLWFERQL